VDVGLSYRVHLSSKAELQLANAALWWTEHRSADQAARWFAGFRAAIDSLAENPQHHPVAREAQLFDFTLRQLLYGLGNKPTHRALFEIHGDMVRVYAIRHLAQRDLRPEDL